MWTETLAPLLSHDPLSLSLTPTLPTPLTQHNPPHTKPKTQIVSLAWGPWTLGPLSQPPITGRTQTARTARTDIALPHYTG
jgi:hypothetical protein